MKPAETSHRQNYIDILASEILDKSDESGLTVYNAATRVVLDWLGYDSDTITFVDSKDRGIDAWYATEKGIEIFQVKTHKLSENGFLELTVPFDVTGVLDLGRGRDFLLYEELANVASKGLQQLLHAWAYAIYNHKYNSAEGMIPVTLQLVVLGVGLSEQASLEFETLQRNIELPTQIRNDVRVQFRAVLQNIDDIINVRWRENNRKWVDINNNESKYIDLTPSGEYISDNANAIFYCRAIDLVNAYKTLGYQIFEPNVRALIKNSRINQAIRNSIKHQRSRRDFRFLNNGVTMTCSSFNKPKGGRRSFQVWYPGIVNGLQTVAALHSAYEELSDREKQDFEENCAVMVRLLMNNAVSDMSEVVRATNNQNPMQPRNLRSNNPEQKQYAYMFSELGWFYEAKQGAWDAFSDDYKRWQPQLGKNPREFRTAGGGRGGGKARRVDNLDLAQDWLAFIGFSTEAANDKKRLFDDNYYELMFLSRTRRHGYHYERLSAAKNDSIKSNSPDASLMLVAFLCREFARAITPSSRDNRHETCERLEIDSNRMSAEELAVKLSEDDHFILNQALGSMSLLFTEFVGFILFQSLGENIHRIGNRILGNHSFRKLATELSFEEIVQLIAEEKFASDDLLVIFWLAFVETIQQIMYLGWGQAYRTANIKVRFIYSKQTRDPLYSAVERMDKAMQRKSYMSLWTSEFSEGEGLFDFVQNHLLSM